MLKNLRKFMADEGIALFLVGSSNEYLNEYISLQENARYLITGFSGSTGDALVTPEEVFLFVDGRYHLQAETETDPGMVNVVKVGLDKSPQKALLEKIEQIAAPEQKIGVVSTKISCSSFKELQKILENKEGTTIAEYEFDPVSRKIENEVLQKLVYVPPKISGKTKEEKLKLVKNYMLENDIEVLLITNLEEIAYISNLRGKEIPYSSCFKARAVIYRDKLHIFREKNQFDEFLQNISAKNVYFSPGSTTLSVYRKIEKITEKMVEIKESYISTLKSVKNDAELDYIKECFTKTDTVVDRAICWLNQGIEKGQKITEKDFSERVKQFFIEEGATGLSFEPITASGANTAFIHYTHPDPQKTIKKNDLVLLDCGGYFEYGYATDQTRTFIAGGTKSEPTKEQKHLYTAVLKAFLQGMNYEIKEDTTGFDIDKTVRDIIEANKPEGFSFSHSTGHGIGIPVHEAPPRLGPSELSKAALSPGMCFTIEPGLYCDGKGGVRIENSVTLAEENGQRRIKTLTRARFDRNLTDYAMLSEQEIIWLNTLSAT